MMVIAVYLLSRISRLIIQACLLAEEHTHNMISDWLRIRKQLKTGAVFEFWHDATHVIYR